jgi:hypothetical protein
MPNQEPEHDTAADHREFPTGLCKVVGSSWRTMIMSPAPTRPWPTDTRGKLIWMARNGAVPHWPTAEQRDASWMRVHAEEHARTQEQLRRHRNVHGRITVG